MPQSYYGLKDLIAMMDEPNRSICNKIFDENHTLFSTVRGSSHNHQAWHGGYAGHIREVMNIGVLLYNLLHTIRPLPFSLSDVLLVLFLHDIEKPWKYELFNGELRIKTELQSKDAQLAFRSKKLEEYGIKLTPDQENGMKYVEGENRDYSSTRRTMGPLAALCHMADITSARIWFNHPSKGGGW